MSPKKPDYPDDMDLFRQMMGDVKPSQIKERAAPVARRAAAAVKPPATEPPQLSVDAPAGIDRNTHDRFRRGEMEIESKLDLHGRTLDAAFADVKSFIAANYRAGRRCVLIITGKGRQKPDADIFEQRGGLRRSLPDWLNHADLRPKILAFAPAQPRHGGDGAYYVLLKRKRD